jgi:hypothetical protein
VSAWAAIGYHATAAANLDSILKDGLLPSENGREGDCPDVNEGVSAVYMFSLEADAEYFAREERLDLIVIADCIELETEHDPGWETWTDAWRVLGPVPPELITDWRRL